MRNRTGEQTYLDETFGLEIPELQRAKEAVQKAGLDFMSISAHEARLLQFLIRAFQVRTVVEVGTLFGYSALCMAQALPKDGQVITIEASAKNFAAAQSLIEASSQKSKIRAVLGKGHEVLPTLTKDGPFDMVFIDADKVSYLDYLDWAEKNVRTGGLIVGDNTFLFGSFWGESRDPDVGPAKIQVMKDFNRRLADPAKYNSILIPTQEGMTIAQKL